jgi:CBS domain-containing protein
MEEEELNDEFSIMYEESVRVKVLNSETFRTPIKHLKVRKPVSIDRKHSVQEAVTLMQQRQFGCVLVTEKGKLAGIITERDVIIKALGTARPLSDITIEEMMTARPEAFQPEESIAYVMNAMHVGGFRHVPVVDEQNVPLAVVSVKDIVGFIVENFPEEILNLPPKPLRSFPHQDGG